MVPGSFGWGSTLFGRDDDVGAVLCGTQSNGVTDAAGGAGDEEGLTYERSQAFVRCVGRIAIRDGSVQKKTRTLKWLNGPNVATADAESPRVSA